MCLPSHNKSQMLNLYQKHSAQIIIFSFAWKSRQKEETLKTL